jgi:hypothetical protein
MNNFYPISFTEADMDFCVDMGVRRNEAKKNQTLSRGWPSRVKHIMGVIGEYADERYLNATMDWKIYGTRGDRSRPDGVLPDGRRILSKSVGRRDIGSIWVPMDCLEKASAEDVVIAFQVIPVEQSFSTYLYTDLGFLGWLPVADFIKQGRRSDKHYEAMESIPGKKLTKDICWVTGKSKLRSISELGIHVPSKDYLSNVL